jgi:hypothetical protein
MAKGLKPVAVLYIGRPLFTRRDFAFFKSGHRVITTGKKGVATENSPDSQPASPRAAMPGNGLRGVVGTAGCEAALPAEERTQGQLVGTDQELENVLHAVY